MLEEFSLEALKNLDYGVLAAAFKAEVSRVLADIQDRPTDERKRVVAIAFTFVPNVEPGKMGVDGDGQMLADEVSVEAEVTSKVPTRVSKVYTMKTRRMNDKDVLLFNAESPDEPDQLTLTDELRRAGARRASDVDGGRPERARDNATSRAIDQGVDPGEKRPSLPS